MTQFLINAILWVVLIGLSGITLLTFLVVAFLWRMFKDEFKDAGCELKAVRQRIRDRVTQ